MRSRSVVKVLVQRRASASPHIYDVVGANGPLGNRAPYLAGGARTPCEPGSEWLRPTTSAAR